MIGVGAALLLVPLAIGVVFPMDGGESPGINDTDDCLWNDTDAGANDSDFDFELPDSSDPDAYDTDNPPFIHSASD